MRYWIFYIFLFTSVQLIAQKVGPASSEYDDGWISIGFGTGSPYELSFSSTVNFGRKSIFQIALHGIDDFHLNGGMPIDGSGSVSISYGISGVNDFGRIAMFLGPGYSWGEDYKSPNKSKYKTIGLVTSLQLIVSPFKEIGLGFDMFANINPKQSSAGVSLIFVIEGNK